MKEKGQDFLTAFREARRGLSRSNPDSHVKVYEYNRLVRKEWRQVGD